MAAPDDLVSLASVQAWLGQSGDATLLAAVISQVSRAMLSMLGRASLLPRAYFETRDGDGRATMMLRQWPVLSVEGVAVNGRAFEPAPPPAPGVPLGAGYLLEQLDAAPPGQAQALHLRGACFERGVQNIQVAYHAGYRVDAEAAVAPAPPGPYTLVAAQSLGPWALDCGVVDADSGQALSPVAGAPGPGQYSVSAGAYVFSAADAGKKLILSYGYTPADLAEAAMEWSAERYLSKNRIGQRSKSLGGQETVRYDIGAIPAFVAAAIQPYKRIVWPC